MKKKLYSRNYIDGVSFIHKYFYNCKISTRKYTFGYEKLKMKEKGRKKKIIEPQNDIQVNLLVVINKKIT